MVVIPACSPGTRLSIVFMRFGLRHLVVFPGAVVVGTAHRARAVASRNGGRFIHKEDSMSDVSAIGDRTESYGAIQATVYSRPAVAAERARTGRPIRLPVRSDECERQGSRRVGVPSGFVTRHRATPRRVCIALRIGQRKRRDELARPTIPAMTGSVYPLS
jgi:hypothetical protein